MKIKVTGIYVDDQEKALRFYTDILGFVKKADVTQGPFRWLTVASPEEPDGVELQLAPNDNPAANLDFRCRNLIEAGAARWVSGVGSGSGGAGRPTRGWVVAGRRSRRR